MPGIRKKEWFDDDSLWKFMYPLTFPKRILDNAPSEVAKILRLAKPRGKAVLDLCCGPGRHSVELAKKGYKVTGVDRTKYYLVKARANARKAGAKIKFVLMDMRDFKRPASYDMALSLYTSFGYFDEKEQDMMVLENILASLRPGGVFVIETIGKEYLAKIYAPTTSSILPNGTLVVACHEAIKDWTRMKNKWIFIRNGRARSIHFEHTLFSGQELRDLLLQAGFADVRLYGNFDGDSYGPGSPRLVAVAKKPK